MENKSDLPRFKNTSCARQFPLPRGEALSVEHSSHKSMHYRKWVGSEFVDHASGIAKHEIPQVGKWNELRGKASVHHQMVYATQFSAPNHINEPIDNWNRRHIVI